MVTSTRTNDPLTVLFSPAHTLIDEDQFGSEYYWTYKLIQQLALTYGVHVIALTIRPHVTQSLPGVRFVSVEPGGDIPRSDLDSLRFHLRCYTAAREILRSGQHIDVVHHMLPFGFRATFNLLALLRRRGDPPLLIGPLQPPYAHSGGEEWHVSSSLGVVSTPPEPPEPAAPLASRLFGYVMPLLYRVVRPTLTALSARTLRRASAVVAVSQLGAERYRSYSGIDNVSIIPPGVDTDEFHPATDEVRRARGEDGRPVVILACGRLSRRKSFDVAIRAVSRLVKEGLPVQLRLVGDGPLQESLESLARELGVADAVTFVGSVPHSEIAHEYRRADIFCSTSLGEGFATVALEALACGLPIVATPTGGFREVLSCRQVGVLTPFGDADALATALRPLIADRAMREEMGRRAREIALHEYDWQVVAGRYIDLYRRIARPDR